MGVLDDLGIEVSGEKYPWGVSVTARTVSGDARLDGYRAIIVEDTTSDEDNRWRGRLTTMIVDFPRCILPEMNTHRVFSRNSASSRARSVRTTISSVMEHPYIPIFTGNRKGMTGETIEGGDFRHCMDRWLVARDKAVSSELGLLLGDLYTGDEGTVEGDWGQWIDKYYGYVYHGAEGALNGLNVHKQNANRLIEPFMWHEMLITSTDWNNFFTLRTDSAAQPEMQVTAKVMKAAYRASDPVLSNYHSPFIEVDDSSRLTVDGSFMESASECARISYRDRSAIDLRNSTDLASKMLNAGHMSPFEHQAVNPEGVDVLPEFIRRIPGSGRNFSGPWVQYRAIVENAFEEQLRHEGVEDE